MISGTYKLTLKIFYQDDDYEYSQVVIEREISFYHVNHTNIWSVFTSLIFGGVILFGFYFVALHLFNKYFRHENSQERIEMTNIMKKVLSKNK